ncbi:alpha/beta hydrolase [Spirillospora sp. NPDC048911]|uniref:alpha/beta hydrolase n=1 Tax=Spirillospora sp. NPDC048911 TaxID=3364527 RepID=UPI003716E3CC
MLADWVLRKDPAGLRANYAGEPDYPVQNTYATYTATQCRDTSWPRAWKRWHKDFSRRYRQGNKFMTWNNAWYNAPCAFWPVRGGKPQKVGDRNVNILLVQPENDGATQVRGASEVHKLFPNSRFVLERGGIFHGSSLTANANACVNGHVIAYLRDGTRPDSTKGADAYCDANPAPVPTS